MRPGWKRDALATAFARITSAQPVGPREFFWLCLPALLIGLLLRLHFLWLIPQGYFGADSGSYFDFSHEFFSEGRFELNPKRRWFYPIVLALLTPLPAPCWYLVPLLQHLLGLATVVGIGWITLRLSATPRLTVPLVTLFAATWPRMLWYEHEFIAESFLLAAFVLTVSLALIPGLTRSQRGLFCFCLSLIFLAGFKAAGRFLWLGVILALLLTAGDPHRWAWTVKSALAGFASLLVAATVGKSSQGYWLLLNSVLPLVQESGEPHARYREALRPLILESRGLGADYPWAKYKYKKILNKSNHQSFHPEWAALLKDKQKFSRVAHRLSMEAIRNHPLTFVQYTLSSMAIAVAADGVNHRFIPARFWEEQRTNTMRRWSTEPDHLTLAFRKDRQGFERLAAEGSRKSNRALGLHRWIDQQLRPLAMLPGKTGMASMAPRPFGLLMLAGALLSLRPGLLRKSLVLLLPSGLYLFAVFAVGDAVSRYLHPVEWVAFVLAGVAIEALILAALRLGLLLRPRSGPVHAADP